MSAGSEVSSNTPEAAFQVGSFAAVPDTGSSAALFGGGIGFSNKALTPFVLASVREEKCCFED